LEELGLALIAGVGDLHELGHRESGRRLAVRYGEWLRREKRRVDAREQLRTAHDMLVAIGMEAFADRARNELQASGEKVRKRTVETRDDLTAHERQIAPGAVQRTRRLRLAPGPGLISGVCKRLDAAQTLAAGAVRLRPGPARA
jgi:hypothetical protein